MPIKHYFLDLLERRPAVGYFGAMVPTGAGFWVLVQKLTALGALISISVGILVGLVTLRVQLKTLKKLSEQPK